MTDTQAVHAPPIAETEPCGDLCTRTLAMPADTNQNGDIFGGWLLSQMDIGGGVFASKIAKSRTVTVAIEAMNFRKPVYVGDLVSVHANLVKIGRTSVTVHLEAWVLRRKEMQSILVTDGNFTYVSIDEQGHPQAIKQDEPPISAWRGSVTWMAWLRHGSQGRTVAPWASNNLPPAIPGRILRRPAMAEADLASGRCT